MSRRGVRLGLVVAFVFALAAGAALIYSGHQRAVDTQTRARALDLSGQRFQSALLETRASLQGALVPGQGEDYWLPRAATALDAARAELTSMRDASGNGAVLNDVDAAAASLDDVAKVETEVRRLLKNDQRTQAARLVFGDGIEASAAAKERVESARITERDRSEAELQVLQTTEWMVAGLLAALSMIVVGLLVPATKGRADQETAAATIVTETLPLHDTVAAPAAPVAAPAASPAPSPAPAPEAAHGDPLGHGTHDGMPGRDRRKAPELRAAADLCSDFARLIDAQEMPGLLERAARLLDATGFVVWLADGDGQWLVPSLAHGFAAATLARMPAIPRDADNATASAFRHAEMQIVRTNGMSPGAIVVPIVGSGGCVGVMAAEVRHGREASESARALARIVAAQLATLVSSANANAAVPDVAQGASARQVG